MRKRRPRKRRGDRELRVIRLWTKPEIAKVFPYMRSITQGLREHWLAAAAHGVRAERLTGKAGRPGRKELIAIEDAHTEKRRAMDRFEESLAELNELDIFCIDPVKGITWIPCRVGEDLAWYIFDSFDDGGLIGWRLHSDAVDTVRPIAEMIDDTRATGPAA